MELNKQLLTLVKKTQIFYLVKEFALCQSYLLRYPVTEMFIDR